MQATKMDEVNEDQKVERVRLVVIPSLIVVTPFVIVITPFIIAEVTFFPAISSPPIVVGAFLRRESQMNHPKCDSEGPNLLTKLQIQTHKK